MLNASSWANFCISLKKHPLKSSVDLFNCYFCYTSNNAYKGMIFVFLSPFELCYILCIFELSTFHYCNEISEIGQLLKKDLSKASIYTSS